MLNYTKGKHAIVFQTMGSGDLEEALISVCLNPAIQASSWVAQGNSVLSMVVEVGENTYAVILPFFGRDEMEKMVTLANQIVPIYIGDLSSKNLILEASGCIIIDDALDHISEDIL